MLAPLLAFFIGFLPLSAFSMAVNDTYYVGSGANGPVYGYSYSEVCDKFLQSHGYSLSLKRLEGNKCAAYSDRYLLTTYLNTAKCSYRDLDDPAHICYESPEPDCPESGTKVNIGSALSSPDSGAGPIEVTISKTGSYNGCKVTREFLEVDCYLHSTDPDDENGPLEKCFAFGGYEYTGEPADNTDPNMSSDFEEIDQDADPVDIGEKPEETEIVYHEDTQETLADGSTVDVESFTETTTRGAGTDKVVTQDKTVFKRSDGIVKTETTTTTTITNSDGSKTVTTETNVHYTGHGADYAVVDHNTGTVQQTSEPDTSASGTTTTTDTYDADGNKTGSKTTSESTGDKKTEEKAEESNFCKDNPYHITCKSWENGTNSEVTFAIDDQRTAVDQAWGELSTVIDDVQDEIKSVFDVSDLGGQSLGCYSFIDFMGSSFDACMSDLGPIFGQIGRALVFLTLLLILYMLLKD